MAIMNRTTIGRWKDTAIMNGSSIAGNQRGDTLLTWDHHQQCLFISSAFCGYSLHFVFTDSVSYQRCLSVSLFFVSPALVGNHQTSWDLDSCCPLHKKSSTPETLSLLTCADSVWRVLSLVCHYQKLKHIF